MIYTVFSTTADAAMQWKAELLEYSWGRINQPGELVRLVAHAPQDRLPRHRLARVASTMSWSPHPYTGDSYAPYNTAAALLEWLFTERIDGTVLLVEPGCVFRAAVATEVGPGQAQGTAWRGLAHTGTGPFGLDPSLAFLDRFCVNRTLEIPRVTLPVLIHAGDLRRLAARWLELMSLIREEMAVSTGSRPDDAAEIAYAVAAAEAGVAHTIADLGGDTGASPSRVPLLEYKRPIESENGDIAWDERAYQPWTAVDPQGAAQGSAREFLALLEEHITRRANGGDLAFLRPRRRPGVRVGRILDRILLEIPGRADTCSLNPSAAAIWELCDGARSLADVGRELEQRFQLAPGTLGADIQSVIDHLESVGALDLASA
jgi:hypothetical protein